MTVKARIGDVKSVYISEQPFNDDLTLPQFIDMTGDIASAGFKPVQGVAAIDALLWSSSQIEVWTLANEGIEGPPIGPGSDNYLLVVEHRSGSWSAFRGLFLMEDLAPWERLPELEAWAYALFTVYLNQAPVIIDIGSHESRSPAHGDPGGAPEGAAGEWRFREEMRVSRLGP